MYFKTFSSFMLYIYIYIYIYIIYTINQYTADKSRQRNMFFYCYCLHKYKQELSYSRLQQFMLKDCFSKLSAIRVKVHMHRNITYTVSQQKTQTIFQPRKNQVGQKRILCSLRELIQFLKIYYLPLIIYTLKQLHLT